MPVTGNQTTESREAVARGHATVEGDDPPGSLAAYVAPFSLFLLLTSMESQSWLGLSYEAWYLIKILVVMAALVYFRRHYPAYSPRGIPLGIAAGCVGIILWIALAKLQESIPGLTDLLSSILGNRVGYNPFENSDAPFGGWGFVAVRLLGLAVIVPVMEEIFWRGFLARYLINERFTRVPQGVFTPASFAIVTALFVAVHPELLAATAWGMLDRKSVV